jgi:hypothetical protein
MQRQLDRRPEAMTLRRRTVEHVFGTLKCWMGATHFLTRGLGRLSGHARSTHAPDAASNPHSRRRPPRAALRSRGFLPRGLSDACPLSGAVRPRPRPTCGGRRRIALNGFCRPRGG